jgi:SAM-dependent methyltransferase
MRREDAPGTIRTCDLCLRRAALYPLSYGRGEGKCSRTLVGGRGAESRTVRDVNDDEVIAYYESGVELGRLETPVGRLELARTTLLLERVLEPGCSVLDVGGGTGVYAAWLAERGHKVTLVEPVGLHLEEARARAGWPPRFAVEEGDARSLPLAGGSVDAVLLLGPLYHLGERAERIRVLHESRRVCRAGGIVLGAAISRYAPLLGAIRGRLLEDEEVMANIGEEVATGRRVPGSRRRGRFPDAYFHLPDELREEMSEAGLQPDAVYGIEGPAWMLDDETLARQLGEPRLRDQVLAAARWSERDLAAASAHLLAVACA